MVIHLKDLSRHTVGLLVIGPLPLLACGHEDLDMKLPRSDCRPVWLWMGDYDDAPPCPDGNAVDWEGWMNEQVPQACEACNCGPAVCALPSRVTTHAPICPGGDTASIAFDAGEGWNGACTALTTPIPGDMFASVTYQPPSILPSCTPSSTPEPLPITATFARACRGAGERRPPGFLSCITPETDGSCRESYPEQLTITDEFIDTRACTPCACGEPEGGRCEANVSLYADAACSNEIDTALGVGLGDAPCVDIPIGAPLAALRARFTSAEPGTCTPTVSTLAGSAKRGATRTVCCTRDQR